MMTTARELMAGIDIAPVELEKLWTVIGPDAEIANFHTFGGDEPPEDWQELGTVSVLGDGQHSFYQSGELVANVNWGVGYCEVDLVTGRGYWPGAFKKT